MKGLGEMTAGLESNDKTHADKVTEAEEHQAELLTRSPHLSVAHLKLTGESFIMAIEYQRSEGNLVSWLHSASMAEGIATVLCEMTGHKGHREGAVLRKVKLLRVEAELALIKVMNTY